jgi:hypothetical protein
MVAGGFPSTDYFGFRLNFWLDIWLAPPVCIGGLTSWRRATKELLSSRSNNVWVLSVSVSNGGRGIGSDCVASGFLPGVEVKKNGALNAGLREKFILSSLLNFTEFANSSRPGFCSAVGE